VAARQTLAALGIARSSYQRRLREEAWAKAFRPLAPHERPELFAPDQQHPSIRYSTGPSGADSFGGRAIGARIKACPCAPYPRLLPDRPGVT
jgi:hypothetical protein